MATCSICNEKSFSTYMVEYNRPICKKCMRKAGLLTKLGFVNMKRAIELCGGKPTVEGIRCAIHSTPPSCCNSYYDSVMEIDGMDGHSFEYFCAEVLRNNGFSDVKVTPGSGDQGVDILAEKGGVRYAIQCKNYASPLNNTPVQEVSAGKTFYNCHVGVVLTNSTFTSGAVSLAKATGVLLWDRRKLSELIGNASTTSTAQDTSAEEITHTPTTPQVQPSLTQNRSKSISKETSSHGLPHEEAPLIQHMQKHLKLENIDIEIDVSSANQFGIAFDNFGIEMDDDDADGLELLFDVIGKGGRMLPCDIDIVCNLYAEKRKVATETDTIYRDSFRKRDSLCVYFEKKNICKTATRIELFCKKW